MSNRRQKAIDLSNYDGNQAITTKNSVRNTPVSTGLVRLQTELFFSVSCNKKTTLLTLKKVKARFKRRTLHVPNLI